MEDRVAELELRLAAVEQRLRKLEGQAPGASATVELDSEPTLGNGSLSNASTLIGRVLLIFGGAYLLRAITENAVVPTALGISMGATYALFWLFMAHRRGGDESQRTGALFYGGASTLLALPLLVEATGRFALLSGLQGIIALTGFCALSLLVAAARDLRLLAWLTAAGGIGTAFVVLKLSQSAVPVSVFLILLGVGTLWACYWLQWKGPQWLGALGANAGVLALAMLSTSEQWTVAPLSVFLTGAMLLLAYLLSFALHTHIRSHNVGVFEAIQALLAIGIAFLAASIAARAGQIVMLQVGSPDPAARSLCVCAGVRTADARCPRP